MKRYHIYFMTLLFIIGLIGGRVLAITAQLPLQANSHGNAGHPVSLQPSLSPQVKQLPPAPPSTPPPNRTRSGGSLSGNSCAAAQQPVSALVPVENPVVTTAAHPTFLFHVPYGSDQIQYGEFSLLVGPDETTRLYQTRFTLPDRPGIVSLSLPNAPEAGLPDGLKEGTFYHWYFKLFCYDNPTNSANLQVDGWVQRVALTPERQRQIAAASPEIWYDALAHVAALRLTTPADSGLLTQWRNLLQSIDATALTQEPLVGAVVLADQPPSEGND